MHNEIVHEFLQAHPEECAREIENFPLDDILVFLKHLSKRDIIPLISSLIPSIAAVCLQNLSIEETKAIIQDLPLVALKKILPHIHEHLRLSLVETLPNNRQIALQHALQFSEQTVGAFINTQVLFLPQEHNVQQTLEFIRKFPEEITPLIFCIDNRGELQGMIALKDILIAPDTQIISHIMQTCPLVLSADTPIQSIAFDEAWQVQSVLPVTDEHHILIGVLEYHKIVTQIQNLLSGDRKDNFADSFAQIMFMFSHTTEDILTEILTREK